MMNNEVLISRIGMACSDAKRLAILEILEFLVRYPEVHRRLKISKTRRSDGSIVLNGYKLSEPLAIFTYSDTEEPEIEIQKGSKMTKEEVEKYLEEGSIPTIKAVEIYTRSTPMHDVIKQVLNGKGFKPNMTSVKAFKLLAKIGDSSMTRSLAILPVVLNKLSYGLGDNGELPYKDFLKKNPISTDKIVRAMTMVWTIIEYEENELLKKFGATEENVPCLRDQLLEYGDTYTEAARKLAGKMSIAGKQPLFLTVATSIRNSMVQRNLYLRD